MFILPALLRAAFRLFGRRGGPGGGQPQRRLELRWHQGNGSTPAVGFGPTGTGVRVATASPGWLQRRLGGSNVFNFDRFMDTVVQLTETQVLPAVRTRLNQRTGRLASSLRVERSGAHLLFHSEFYGAYQNPSAREAFVDEFLSRWPAIAFQAGQAALRG